MRKYGKWALTLGLLAAMPGATLSIALPAHAAEKQTGKEYNQEMADKIAKALRAERLSAHDVTISFQDGIATIKGVIADRKQKGRVQQVVGKIPGITQVDTNQLKIAGKQSYSDRMGGRASGGVVQAGHTGSGTDRRVQQVNAEGAEGVIAHNQQVANQIGAALSGANLDGYDIAIRYHNGVALLEGSVPTNAQRKLAEQLAGEAPDVRSVANRLETTEEPQQPDRSSAAPAGYGPQMPQGPGGYDPRMMQDPRMQDPRMAMLMAQGMDPRMIQAAYQGGGMPGAPVPPPAPYAHPGAGMTQAGYNMPSLPEYAWPAYSQYPNVATVNYPQQYSASAWPYIGPFYPYPQVPLGWRDATLRWDDGQWNLQFRQRTDKWFWFMHPKNW